MVPVRVINSLQFQKEAPQNLFVEGWHFNRLLEFSIKVTMKQEIKVPIFLKEVTWDEFSTFCPPAFNFLETFESMPTVKPYTKFQRVLHADHLCHSPDINLPF